MPLPAQPRIVLGFCPEIYRADMAYLFAPAVAEFSNGSWIRLGNAASSYPPSGAIFVPRELCPTSFRHRDIAGWEVEDQPHYSESKLGARYRAIRLVEGPLEVVPVPLASTSPDVRGLLLEEGVAYVTQRLDRSALIEFKDGRIALVRLSPHPSVAHRSIVTPGTLAYPLPAWQASQPPSTQVLTLENQTRRIATFQDLPRAPEALDLATLEEALTCAKGGLGSAQAVPIAKVRLAIEHLEEAVTSFEGPAWAARRARFTTLLDEATEAIDARERWEAFLSQHPLFRSSFDAAISLEKEKLRSSLRVELLAAEPQLKEQIEKLEKEYREWEELIASAREEVKEQEALWDELSARIEEQSTARVAVGEQNGAFSAPPARPDISSPAVQEMPPHEAIGNPKESLRPSQESARSLTSPAQAIQQLEKNFLSLGLLKVSARLLAREVFVGASLGQLLLFRGSFAGAVAEVCALSLTGELPRRLSVPLGAIGPLKWSEVLAPEATAVLVEGVNRSCFASYGEALRELLEQRALGRRSGRLPILLGTLAEGPSTLPVGPEMIAYGPSFDTDCFSWDLRRKAKDSEPGWCDESAWDVEEKSDWEAKWGDALDETFPKACIAWERIARSALRRLGTVLASDAATQLHSSFAFAWVVPRYVAFGGNSTLRPFHFPEELSKENLLAGDQRLMRLLQSAGLEEYK